MRCLLLPLLIIFSIPGKAQNKTGETHYKTYHLSDRGDTLNAIDLNGLKQGKWTVHVAPLRGEPGYEEEGVFVNNRKEGIWRRFNLMGDPVAIENYKWGNKNGICRYFAITGMIREESWRAVNPDHAYDTIDVPDPKFPDKYERVIVKNTGTSLKNGTWRYYDPRTGRLLTTEHWFLDKLKEPEPEIIQVTTDSLGNQIVNKDTSKVKKVIPKEVLEFEKKTSGKKKALRDGRTGG